MNSGIASEGFVICGDHPGSGVIPGFSGRTGQDPAEGPRAAIQAPRPNAWETCGLPAGWRSDFIAQFQHAVRTQLLGLLDKLPA
jgi:hypothetical protein